MKRIFYFLLTNIAVMIMLSIVLAVLGLFGVPVNPNDATGLLVFSFVFGMLGSLISLFLSKTIAVRSVRAKIIFEARTEEEKWLVDTIARLATQWGFKAPEVAIYDSPEMNAFATGARKNASLIAVSTGLLRSMTRDEVEGVLGHEIAHIGNGDMVTMTLIQGVVNTFVIFLSRTVAKMIAQRFDSNLSSLVFFVSTLLLQVIFGLLASVVVMWFSRHREYRADEGSARHVGASKMIAALRKLSAPRVDNLELPASLNAMGIAGGKDSLFSTHPSIENRIAVLQGLKRA